MLYELRDGVLGAPMSASKDPLCDRRVFEGCATSKRVFSVNYTCFVGFRMVPGPFRVPVQS